jgi:hypothetical protein
VNNLATTSATAVPTHAEAPLVISAVAALEQDVRWHQASEAERVVLKRIAMQRDRWVAAKHAQQQAKALRTQADTVPADAPLMERLVVFAKLHPIATAAVAGLAVMVGPRKLMRYGGLALPLISKLKR